MKAKHILMGMASLVVIALVLLMWNWRSLMIGYHTSQRLAEFHKIYEIGPQGDQEPHIDRFKKHQESLVRLKHFSYEKILLKHVKVPSEEHKRLFAELSSQTSIERGYCEIGGYGETPDEIRIWGTTDQMDLMKSIIAKHEAQARG